MKKGKRITQWSILFFICGLTLFSGKLNANQLVWKGYVSGNGSATSQIKLTQGRTYFIKASGYIYMGRWFRNRKKILNDACYEFNAHLTPTRIPVLKNSLNINLGSRYNPNHVYRSARFVSDGRPLSFWIYDSDYRDNRGRLSVFVYQLPATDSKKNLVKDPEFRFFGSRQGPWGKGQYQGRGIWWNSRGADSRARRVSIPSNHFLSVRHGISSALHIRNRSSAAPHVYGTTVQKIPCTPGRYRIRLWAAGKNLTKGAVYIVSDSRWQQRPITLQAGSYAWKRFSGTFSVNSDTIQLRIITANRGDAWLSGVHIERVNIE